MRQCRISFKALGLAAVVGLRFASLGTAAEGPWHTAAPETQGFDSVKLEALRADLAKRGTKAFLVIRNDTILCEWYAPGQNASTKFGTASLAKAIVGGLSLAVAMDEGLLKLDDPASKFIPQWHGDARKSRITLRQLGSHTSGIEDAEADDKPHDQLPGWKGDFWKRLPVPNDPFTTARDRAPLVIDPGKKMAYSNPGIALMTLCVTAALRDSPQKDIRSLLRDRVMRPMGVADTDWSAGYGQTFNVDGLPLVGSWGGGSYTARAAASIGRLILREGNWDGKQLLSEEVVRATTADAGTPGPCGIGWWSNNENDCPKLPRDAFFGSGAGHQLLLVIPSRNLVVVRFGTLLGQPTKEPNSYHDIYCRYLFGPLIDAIVAESAAAGSPEGRGPASPHNSSASESAGAAPRPPSPVIDRIEWAPKETVIRQAPGSDNWPIAWADDDALYAAYGDGNGFDQSMPEKLSLGFARITGNPDNFVGVNFRSPTGEATGGGVGGRKASGLLCLDGILYLLARNTGNSQLAWSGDRGRTWTWAEWKFTSSFGCPTFLNFGKDYAGARDGFVYIYSPDSETAYDPADRMVLGRVPANRIRERSAYEFFVRLDNGQPVWSSDIHQRDAVFTSPGRCYRSGLTYNAGLKRYLWVQILPHSRHPQGPRFQGGFGVYDAPEPWGPWTTAFFTEDWDVGPGETACFPAKWMSNDGRHLALVFSGNDSFSVRSCRIVLRSSSENRP